MNNAVGSAFTVTTNSTGTSGMYISAANITTSNVIISNQPVTRFVPMKRHVDTSTAQSRTRVSMRDLTNIEDHNVDIPSLYYVENGYNVEGFDSHDVTLFRFGLKKTTEHYYFLLNGQRISKKLNGRTFARTPTEALGKSIDRARRYLDILIRRGRNVASFLDKVAGEQDKQGRELREFSKIVESLGNPDHVPSELFKKFSENPKIFDELEL